MSGCHSAASKQVRRVCAIECAHTSLVDQRKSVALTCTHSYMCVVRRLTCVRVPTVRVCGCAHENVKLVTSGLDFYSFFNLRRGTPPLPKRLSHEQKTDTICSTNVKVYGVAFDERCFFSRTSQYAMCFELGLIIKMAFDGRRCQIIMITGASDIKAEIKTMQSHLTG